MARQVVEVKSQETKALKLSPAPILPKMAFPLSNQTGIDLKITVDGKNIRVERAGS